MTKVETFSKLGWAVSGSRADQHRPLQCVVFIVALQYL